MIFIAFILFAVLILAWLMAPGGEPSIKPATIPAAKPGEVAVQPA